MKILISGINGFIGSRLSQHLTKNNHHIIGLSRNKSKLYEFILWDQVDNINLGDVDLLIHCAGIAHDSSKIYHENDYMKINLGLTKKIVQIVKKNKINKVVFLSSVKAVTDFSRHIINENSVPKPKTPYGISKLKSELFLSEALINFEFVKLYIFRLPVVYSTDLKGNLKRIVKFINNFKFWPLGSLHNKKSYLDIRNLYFFIDNILNDKIKPSIYNICDDKILCTSELIKHLQPKTIVINFGDNFYNFIISLSKRLKFIQISLVLKKIFYSCYMDNKKIKHQLKINKTPYNSFEKS